MCIGAGSRRAVTPSVLREVAGGEPGTPWHGSSWFQVPHMPVMSHVTPQLSDFRFSLLQFSDRDNISTTAHCKTQTDW